MICITNNQFSFRLSDQGEISNASEKRNGFRDEKRACSRSGLPLLLIFRHVYSYRCSKESEKKKSSEAIRIQRMEAPRVFITSLYLSSFYGQHLYQTLCLDLAQCELGIPPSSVFLWLSISEQTYFSQAGESAIHRPQIMNSIWQLL